MLVCAMRLAGQVLEFGNASVVKLVRIIHHRYGLEPLLVASLMLELE